MGQLLDAINDAATPKRRCKAGLLLEDEQWGQDLAEGLQLHPAVSFATIARSLKEVTDITVAPSTLALHVRNNCACNG